MQKSIETVSGGTANEDRETRHTACCFRLDGNEIINYHGFFSCGEQSIPTGGLLKQAIAEESKGPSEKRPATLILASQESAVPRSSSSTHLKKTQTEVK